MTYVRRRAEAECYNGLTLERSTFATNCECKESDYECDLNFYRDAKSNHCVPVEESARVEDEECSYQDFYEIPTGYRRVSGNTCIGGISAERDP
jgi:hypothetical protein